MVSWVYTYAKTSQILHFKYVQFIAEQLYLNTAVPKNNPPPNLKGPGVETQPHDPLAM